MAQPKKKFQSYLPPEGQAATLKTISRIMAQRLKLPQTTCDQCAFMAFLIVADLLRCDRDVSIRSFGSFLRYQIRSTVTGELRGKTVRFKNRMVL